MLIKRNCMPLQPSDGIQKSFYVITWEDRGNQFNFLPNTLPCIHKK